MKISKTLFDTNMLTGLQLLVLSSVQSYYSPRPPKYSNSSARVQKVRSAKDTELRRGRAARGEIINATTDAEY